MEYDPQALADAETYLIQYLLHSDPPRDASLFELTDAAQDHHNTTGSWDLHNADAKTVEDLLARHGK